MLSSDVHPSNSIDLYRHAAFPPTTITMMNSVIKPHYKMININAFIILIYDCVFTRLNAMDQSHKHYTIR